MALPRYLRKITEHLPTIPSLGQIDEYEWIFNGMFNDYVDKLLQLTTVSDEAFPKHRAELRELMRIMTSLCDEMKRKGGGDTDDDDDSGF